MFLISTSWADLVGVPFEVADPLALAAGVLKGFDKREGVVLTAGAEGIDTLADSTFEEAASTLELVAEAVKV